MFLRACALVVVVAGAAWWVMVEPPLPHLHPDPWWAPGHPKPEDTSIRKFTINIPQEAVDDLTTLLNLKPRLVPALHDVNFTYGVHPDTLQTILQYWRHHYNWRQREARLNKYPHYL
ncbi:hypothetical protein Pmani_011895 [Petrolisthes manimaculis]|uniref:Epoxide hydrolase N-terminal domain-containing protein n=1 Tax=Petrolisthes manimaculis TaxID=1843537 RepID=A0AAE1Q088_9EUCA|nr:hypothetical protein Pmani_011895 [Petrolisthes manimaculis]